jgi:hypothetical protein
MLGHHLVFVVCILHFEIIFSTLYLILKKKKHPPRLLALYILPLPYRNAPHRTAQHSALLHYKAHSNTIPLTRPPTPISNLLSPIHISYTKKNERRGGKRFSPELPSFPSYLVIFHFEYLSQEHPYPTYLATYLT